MLPKLLAADLFCTADARTASSCELALSVFVFQFASCAAMLRCGQPWNRPLVMTQRMFIPKKPAAAAAAAALDAAPAAWGAVQ